METSSAAAAFNVIGNVADLGIPCVTRLSYLTAVLPAHSEGGAATTTCASTNKKQKLKDGIDIEAMRSTAAALHRERKMSQALHEYDNLLLSSPHDSDATYQRALCLSQMGYVEEAVQGFERAMELCKAANTKTTNSRLHERPGKEEINLANIVLDGRGEKHRALEIYQRTGPDSPLVVLAGVCLDSLGRHDEARKCYQQALQLKGGDADHTAMVHLSINYFRRIHSATCNQETKLQDEMEKMMQTVDTSPLSHIASSWRYIATTPQAVWSSPAVHYFTRDMVKLAMESATLGEEHNAGLILEFGVYYGKTIRMMADYFPNHIVHGFDTFEGLPGDWFHTKKGSYSTDGSIPSAPDNVKFYKGLFSETLPGFLKEQPSDAPIRLMNIDCDMYESTKDVFDLVYDRVRPGTIILFDEYVGNPNWKEDEYKAFQEAVEKHGWKYEYIAISMVSQQAIVRII